MDTKSANVLFALFSFLAREQALNEVHLVCGRALVKPSAVDTRLAFKRVVIPFKGMAKAS